MKTILLLLLTLGLTNSYSQTIWRCNNDPSVPLSANMFRTLQEAHDAASANDIIYVEPSYQEVSYGNVDITKTLKIIGNGYDHAINESLINVPFDKRSSIIGRVNIISGTGTILEGLVTRDIKIQDQNVKIFRCKIVYNPNVSEQISLIRNQFGKNASGAKLLKNFITLGSIYATGFSEYDGVNLINTPNYIENVEIKNNIFANGNITSILIPAGSTTVIPSLMVPSAKGFTVSNNYFQQMLSYCYQCTLSSNIIFGPSSLGILNESPASVASNNACIGSNCLDGSNNIFVSNHSIIFEGPNYFEFDNYLRTKAGSPTIGQGLDGTEIGPFGTSDPYRLSGLAPIPQITTYSGNTSNGIYTSNTPMSVQISIKGNN
jgi:hypothetical protein